MICKSAYCFPHGLNDRLDLLLYELVRAVDSWPPDCSRVLEEFRCVLQNRITGVEGSYLPSDAGCVRLNPHRPSSNCSGYRQILVLTEAIQKNLDAADWQIDSELTSLKRLIPSHISPWESVPSTTFKQVLTAA